jgi:hypothetical protein
MRASVKFSAANSWASVTLEESLIVSISMCLHISTGILLSTGQSHLIDSCQNALEIGVVPPGLETLGMDANPRRVFLAQQIEADVA